MGGKVGSGMVRGARRGVFFCAVVGERTCLRFVPADGGWNVAAGEDAIIRGVGTCLRLIECEPETPAWYPDTLQERVYDFREAARRDIWTDWMHETDPPNLQSKVRPLNLRVAEFIRAQEVTESVRIRHESRWPGTASRGARPEAVRGQRSNSAITGA